MHDGAYTTLEAAVRHYLDTRQALFNYSTAQLRQDLQSSHLNDPATLQAMAASLDTRVDAPVALSDGEVADIVSFLRAMTDPGTSGLTQAIPATVPSGLPVD
jgi:cytochrome c peroxidase